MGSPFVESLEHCARLLRDMAEAVILAHEGLDRVKAVEPHQGLELDLLAELATHQVDVAETGDLPRLNARDHLGVHDALISLCIFARGPPAPQAADHWLYGTGASGHC